jgi:predicted acetyltransferase
VSIDIRTIGDGELEAYTRQLSLGFGNDFNPEHMDRRRAFFEFDRNLAAFDGDEVAGTAGIFSFEMTVPGGTLPIAGVTMVTVRSDHRRQGILTAMMTEQLRQVAERGEPVAALWASESVIYGRFGYGQAAETIDLAIRRDRASFAHLPPTSGSVRVVSADEAREQWPALYDRVRMARPGMMSRSSAWWANREFYDPRDWREGFTENLYVNYEAGGELRGYLKYRLKGDWDERSLPAGTVRIGELMTESPDAYTALWQYAFGIDLMERIEAPLRAPDEPLYWMLTDPRRLERRPRDSLWLRILDVERALGGRRYAADGRVVFEMRDAFQPRTAGRYALEAGPGGVRCSRTTSAADIRLDIADLGAIYLGGVRLQTLARAGRVDGDPAALRRADAMFAWDPLPWCPESF